MPRSLYFFPGSSVMQPVCTQFWEIERDFGSWTSTSWSTMSRVQRIEVLLVDNAFFAHGLQEVGSISGLEQHTNRMPNKPATPGLRMKSIPTLQ